MHASAAMIPQNNPLDFLKTLFLERYCADRWHYRYTVGNATETSVGSRFWQLYKAQEVEKLSADYLRRRQGS